MATDFLRRVLHHHVMVITKPELKIDGSRRAQSTQLAATKMHTIAKTEELRGSTLFPSGRFQHTSPAGLPELALY